jgi:hypothetical protein
MLRGRTNTAIRLDLLIASLLITPYGKLPRHEKTRNSSVEKATMYRLIDVGTKSRRGSVTVNGKILTGGVRGGRRRIRMGGSRRRSNLRIRRTGKSTGPGVIIKPV